MRRGVTVLFACAGLGVHGALSLTSGEGETVARWGAWELRLSTTGNTVGLAGVAAGDVSVAGSTPFFWSADFRDTGGRRVLVGSSDGRAAVRKEADSVRILWSGVRLEGDDTVAVEVTVEPLAVRPELLAWRIAFSDIAEGWSLFRYQFPLLHLAADPGDGCALIEPRDWGTITLDPLGRLETRWRIYPSADTAMQFHALQRADRIVYLACHDPRARVKEFGIHPDARNKRIRFGVAQPTRLRFGGDYVQSYPFVLGLLTGDWYDAAQVYRDWAVGAPWTWQGPLHAGKKTPRRAIETPLVLLRLGQEIADPAFVADWAVRTQQWFGVPAVFHWYNWHRSYGSQSIDCYPHYFPTRPGFRPALRRMRGAGLSVMPYFNSRLWRTDFESWQELGRRAAVRDAYGELQREVWMRIPAAVMNPASRLWQEVLASQVLRSVDCGSNAVYLDQLAASAAWPSFDPSHPQQAGETGAWVQGLWQLCDRLRSEGRRIEPDLILAAEGAAEPYVGCVDTFLCGNLNAANSIPLHSAVYHDYVMTFGRYIMARDLAQPRAVLAKFAQQFVFGGQFGWSRAKLDGFLREDNGQAVCLRRMAKLRAAHCDLLAAGRLLPPLRSAAGGPELEVTWYQWDNLVSVRLPQVLNSVWQRADGLVGVLLVNIGDAAQEVRVRLPRSRYPVAAGAEARVYAGGARAEGDASLLKTEDSGWVANVPAVTPVLLTFNGEPPTYPEPPRKPELDLLGGEHADAALSRVLPFRPPEVGHEPDSRSFPLRYEADGAPDAAVPPWVLTGAPVSELGGLVKVRDGTLTIDTLTAGRSVGASVMMPPGPGWDVDRAVGFTVECRLRVTACNDHPRFAFWLQTNVSDGLMSLQVFPDRIVVPGQDTAPADMRSRFRTVRVVGLPGGAGVRVFLDGEDVFECVPYLNGHPSQARCVFGAGASAGLVRADVDYVRIHPWRAVSP